jgi:hypothetical protein
LRVRKTADEILAARAAKRAQLAQAAAATELVADTTGLGELLETAPVITPALRYEDGCGWDRASGEVYPDPAHWIADDVVDAGQSHPQPAGDSAAAILATITCGANSVERVSSAEPEQSHLWSRAVTEAIHIAARRSNQLATTVRESVAALERHSDAEYRRLQSLVRIKPLQPKGSVSPPVQSRAGSAPVQSASRWNLGLLRNRTRR